MSGEVSFKLTDNSGAIARAFENCEDEFLEALGIQGSDNVRRAITAKDAVDTGLMRNSVTFAVSGQSADAASYRGERRSKYRPNAPIPEGTPYSGTAPAAASGHKAVYVGSNLDYFMYQNNGYHRPDGAFVPGIHALEDGMTQLQGQAERIAQKVFDSVTEG